MVIQTYGEKRSVRSRILEKYLILRGTKKGFSSVANTTKFVQQRGTENIKPYVIENMSFSNSLKEEVYEDI